MKHTKINLGKVRGRDRGAYSATTTYELYQTVKFGGSIYTYINKTPSAGHAPTDEVYWQLTLDNSAAVEAAKAASDAAAAANAAAGSIEGLTVTQTSVPNGTALQPTVTRGADGAIQIALQNEKGADGLTTKVNGKEQVNGAVVITGADVAVSATDDRTLEAAIASTASTALYAVTLGVDWTDSAPYTQTVAVNGLLVTDTPMVDVVLSDTVETAQEQLEAWGCVSRMVTAENQITVYCYTDRPTVEIPIQLKVVR